MTAVRLDALAETVAGSIVEQIWQPLADSDRAPSLPGFLARGRILLLQGVASTLADPLAAALLGRVEDTGGGEALRAATDRIRVGVITDSAGTFHRRGA